MTLASTSMSALSAMLPSWSTVLLVLLVAILLLSYWVVRGISVETILASCRLVSQGSVRIGSYSLRQLALRDIVITSPEHLGSHVVIKAKSVSLHPSWDIFKGTPLKVIVDRPWVNGLMDDLGQLHLLVLFQDVGLLREVRATKKPGCPVCGPRGDAYNQECHCKAGHVDRSKLSSKASSRAHESVESAPSSPASGSDASWAMEPKEGKHKSRLAKLFHRKPKSHAATSDAASVATSLPSETSRYEDLDAASEHHAQAGPIRSDGSAASARSRHSDSPASEGNALPDEAPPHLEIPAGGKEVQHPSAHDKYNCGQKLTGTVRIPFVELQLADGEFVVFEEIGKVFGGYLDINIKMGTSIVRAYLKDLGKGIDGGWINQMPQTTLLTGRPLVPFRLQLLTEHLDLRTSGWRTTTGFVLREPASATVTFTPALAKYGLARLHPLLSHAMRLREANSVTAMITPLAMHFPVETFTIKVSPLKLQIKGNKLMRGAMRLLEDRKSKSKRGSLGCWTSAIEADVYRTGELVSKRMDVLVSRDFSVSKAPMHMAMWGHGRVDADEGSIIDAILGIPAYTIKMAGVHGLPDDYMMQISARGSAYRPDIDWLRAAKTLCSLAVERNLPTFGVKPLRAWLDKRCEKKMSKWEPVPAPTEPLPWEHFKRMPKRLKGGRHHGVHVSSDMELPNVYTDKQRRSSSAEAAAEEGGLAERAENAGEDHAQGMAAMPQSRNAPTSLSMRRVSQEAPHEPGSTLGSASPGPGVSEQEAGPCTDIHSRCVDRQQTQTRHHMTPELGEAMRRDLRGRSSGDSLSEREDLDGLDDEEDSDSDDGWLSEEDGKLGLSKSKVTFGHFTPPQREP